MMKSRRVELHAINGLRFWATLLMVVGRAVQSLWIDKSDRSEWLGVYTCSALRRMADDLVSFYFILGGFSITWGYLTRDFDSDAVKQRYWIGRIQRFYPDYFISCVLTFFFVVCVGCWALSPNDWLALIGGWFAWIPYSTSGNLNGPIWFLVVLVWLWFLYPWLITPVKSWVRGDSSEGFSSKLVVLWIVSLSPWFMMLGMYNHFPSYGYASFEQWMWAVKSFPLFRLPEFVMGIALAVRMLERQDYCELHGDPESEETGDLQKPALVHISFCFFALLVILGWIIASTLSWNKECGGCMDVSKFCYGWWQMVDTRFALVSSLIIYSVAELDVAAALAEEGGQQAAVEEAAGMLGVGVWCFLSWSPFQQVNKWGLQAFLYQMPVQICFQGLLTGLKYGITSRCEEQPLTASFAFSYVGAQIGLTYAAAWLMHDRGPLGSLVHAQAQRAASWAIVTLDKQRADASARAAQKNEN